MNKITKTLVSLLSLFALASCGGASESTNPTEEQKTSNSGGFNYEDPSLTEGDFTEPFSAMKNLWSLRDVSLALIN